MPEHEPDRGIADKLRGLLWFDGVALAQASLAGIFAAAVGLGLYDLAIRAVEGDLRDLLTGEKHHYSLGFLALGALAGVLVRLAAGFIAGSAAVRRGAAARRPADEEGPDDPRLGPR